MQLLPNTPIPDGEKSDASRITPAGFPGLDQRMKRHLGDRDPRCGSLIKGSTKGMVLRCFDVLLTKLSSAFRSRVVRLPRLRFASHGSPTHRTVRQQRSAHYLFVHARSSARKVARSIEATGTRNPPSSTFDDGAIGPRALRHAMPVTVRAPTTQAATQARPATTPHHTE